VEFGFAAPGVIAVTMIGRASPENIDPLPSSSSSASSLSLLSLSLKIFVQLSWAFFPLECDGDHVGLPLSIRQPAVQLTLRPYNQETESF
jgi:hypothetical protein